MELKYQIALNTAAIIIGNHSSNTSRTNVINHEGEGAVGEIAKMLLLAESNMVKEDREDFGNDDGKALA